MKLHNIVAVLAAIGLVGTVLGQGLPQRATNITVRMPASLPTAGTNSYTTTNAFPGLSFLNPIALAAPPGETNRLFVVERAGRVIVITNLASPNQTVFLNVTNRVGGTQTNSEGGLLSMAFHPGYASNGHFFLYYTAPSPSGVFTDRLSRFQVSASNANLAVAASETVFFGQLDQANNHNGADLKFGPDGYLYCALGDEGGGCDSGNNSQSITGDFFAAMIRIDVDRRPGSLAPNPHPAIGPATNYAIPPDNPWVGATNFNGVAVATNRVRTEFYAVGLRNPWRFAFDLPSGRLYLNDVGQTLWEEVNLIVRGGNYGWNYREGAQSNTCSEASPPGFTNWVNPLVQYGHGSATNQGFAIGGGHVYRGSLLPELVGRYLFNDYSSGHIWAVVESPSNPATFAWLATDNSITYMLPDPRSGEMLLADLGGQVKRLLRGPTASNALPQTLAETGVFSNLATLAVHPGIIPYDLNVPFWSDHAIKTRWFSVPGTNLAIDFAAEGPWTCPTGAVWIKHFELLLTSGVPASARRLETRLLVQNAGGGYGVTYRWGGSLTNAALVPAGGLDEALLINDGGTIRTQVWRYPSQAECLACHRSADSDGPGFPLGFNTAQLHRDRDYGAATTNQLRALSAAGYFSSPVSNVYTLRALAHPTNEAYSVEYRARSWLESNCRQCHFPGSVPLVHWDARSLTPLAAARIINETLHTDLGNASHRVVVPGDTNLSVLLTRIAQRGPLQMPPLATALVDTQGVDLVRRWIAGLAGYQFFADWQTLHFGSPAASNAAETVDADGDGASNLAEYLTGTNPTNDVPDAWSLALDGDTGQPRLGFTAVSNLGFDVQTATGLLGTAWRSLDEPENAPLFGPLNRPALVPDRSAPDATSRFYRVRLYAP